MNKHYCKLFNLLPLLIVFSAAFPFSTFSETINIKDVRVFLKEKYMVLGIEGKLPLDSFGLAPLQGQITMHTAVTDNQENLLLDTGHAPVKFFSFYKDDDYWEDEIEGYTHLSHIKLKLPSMSSKTIKEVTGHISFLKGKTVKTIDLKISSFKRGEKGIYDTAITSIDDRTVLTIKANINSTIKEFRFLDTKGNLLHANELTRDQDNIYRFEFDERLPRRGKIFVDIYDTYEPQVIPFSLNDIPLSDPKFLDYSLQDSRLTLSTTSGASPLTVVVTGPAALLQEGKNTYYPRAGCKFSINWGDAQQQKTKKSCSEYFQHTYTSPGTFVVKVKLWVDGPGCYIPPTPAQWEDTVTVTVQ